MAVIGALSADPPTALTGTATVQVFPPMGQTVPSVGCSSGASVESADHGQGTEMGDASTCINCGRAVSGAEQKFCPACGQPTPVHRIDWHFLGHELEHSVLHMDRGILYSLKELMLRPGHLMQAYLEGRRANQAKPLLLIMVMAAVVVFLSKYLVGEGVMDGIASSVPAGNGDVAKGMAAAMKAAERVAAWMNQYFALFTLLLLPLEAAAFRLAFHRFAVFNYPEWLVVTAFLTVQTFVFWTLMVVLHRWLPQPLMWVTLISILFGIFSLIQLFREHVWWKTLLRAMLGFGLFFIVSSVLTQVLIVVVAVAMIA